MAKAEAESYLIVYDHKLGVDIDLKAPVLLSILIRATGRGGDRRFGLPIPKHLFVACIFSTL